LWLMVHANEIPRHSFDLGMVSLANLVILTPANEGAFILRAERPGRL